MANIKHKSLFFSTILFGILSLNLVFLPAFCDENATPIHNKTYDEIYKDLKEADFSYIFGLDPYQPDEYTRYMYSPYPLFRSGVNLVFKSTVIPRGYYLLTPREKNGKTYVLFKEKGRVSYTIPVYREENLSETFYNDKLPQVEKKASQTLREKTMNFIGKRWGHKNQRTPLPNAYIEFTDRGIWWDMILYYGDKKYYLLFKKED